MPLNPINQEKFIQVLESVLPEASKSLSLLLNSTINLSFNSWAESEIAEGKTGENIIYSSEFSKPANCNFAIAASPKMAWIVSDLMTGGSGAWADGTEVAEAKLSAFVEAINQSMNGVLTKLKSKAAMEMQNGTLSAPMQMTDSNAFKMNISIEGLCDEAAHIEMSGILMQFLLNQLAGGYTENDGRERGISGVEFAQANPGGTQLRGNDDRNLNLLMDIRMGLTVELGRSEMPLKDILKLAKGSVIELDRLSGEPVDLFVNNKLIARGEVVVIDDNFGLRITQLAGNLNLAQDMGLVAAAAD